MFYVFVCVHVDVTSKNESAQDCAINESPLDCAVAGPQNLPVRPAKHVSKIPPP